MGFSERDYLLEKIYQQEESEETVRKAEKELVYNSKEVFTEDTFSYNAVQIGDYVTQDVVDDAMDCLPPACMRSDCSQIGEPYSHRVDPGTGKYRATYATFKRVDKGIWQYCGHCFRGENVERGKDPVYVEEWE